MSTATQQQPQNGFHTSPNMDPSTVQSQATADAQRSSAASAQFPPQPAKDAANVTQVQNAQQQQNQQQANQQSAAGALPQAGQPLPMSGPAASLMQLRSEIPPAPPPRGTRKRKSPTNASDNPQGPPPPPQPQPQAQVQAQPQPPQQIPHPATLGAPPPGVYPGMPYPYPDYTTAGMPPPHMQQQMPGAPPQMQQQTQPGSPDQQNSGPQRQLSTSKRAEQNRKAQRAFRERRDQHVRALESRSQLLDAALASADEANRRWEECRALVDQLRIENTALRTALQQAQQALTNAGVNAAAAVVKKANEAEGDQAKQQAAPIAADTKEGS